MKWGRFTLDFEIRGKVQMMVVSPEMVWFRDSDSEDQELVH